MEKTVFLGAGPAGLTAAHEMLARAPGSDVTVLEAGDIVGGIARTESYKGYRFDIGGHRFFTKVPEVQRFWEEMMGEDFITVPRLSRIFYRGTYFDYPLKLSNALSRIGIYESARIGLSYAKWQVIRGGNALCAKEEKTFEEWVINRFGGRLYMHFFRSYTEKVWGIPPSEIRADWAAQRIKDLSLPKAVWKALTGMGKSTSLIEEFKYPRLGPGQMWEKTVEKIEGQGATLKTNTCVTKVRRNGARIIGVDVACQESDGTTTQHTLSADNFLSTLALRDLIEMMDPPPPPEVLAAAAQLKYRDFLIVTLVLDHADPFPDNWIYIHEPGVKVGRIQNFRAWSQDMVPNENTASIGMEYFCHKGDGLWSMADEDLIRLASEELEQLGLSRADATIDGTVIRQPKAYPVYDAAYKGAVSTIRDWLRTLENFQTCGRNGLHRYNNQDHSMLSAMLAARNLLGEDHDVWTLNVERAYHEEFEVGEKKKAG